METKKSRYDDYYKARKAIKDLVKKDLVGPVLEDEVIIEAPMQYYAMGKLYPKTQEQDILDMSRGTGAESELESYDASLASTNMRNPSSMGITCTLKKEISQITVSVAFAMYEPMNVIEVQEKEISVERWKDDIDDKTTFWVRKAFNYNVTMEMDGVQEVEILPEIMIRGYVHKVCKDGERIFTLVLINGRETGNDNNTINANMLFQPYIKITSSEDNRKIFTSTIRQVEIKEDFELLEMDMLYNDYKCYGQGHGCSVNWGNKSGIETEEPSYIESTFIPEYNLKQMKAAQIEDLPVLSMDYIVTGDAKVVIKELKRFVQKYKEWILLEENKVNEVEKRLKECAEDHIEKCKFAYNRIDYSIDILKVFSVK